MGQSTPAIDEIFAKAIEKESKEARQAYLDEACGGDTKLRQRIEKLVEVHLKASSDFLEGPATGLQSKLKSELGPTVDVNPAALEAGLAASFNSKAAVVVGGKGHSVLKSLSKQIPELPNVTLHESREDRDSIVHPGSPEIPNQENDSRYQLLGEIARGGMGAVIKGRDTDLGRDLAIKVLLDSHRNRPEVIQRFVEEAQIGGQLQHPGIAPVYELGQFEDQRPFFTMKLVKGDTLAAILAGHEDASEDRPKLLGIFEQICQTMAYAHSKGVLHRDLKPANIMVGAFGEVQVMDWGLSKVLAAGGVADERKSQDKHRDVSVIETRRSVGSDSPGSAGPDTQMGSVMGTPAYMPPEQALGEVDRLDERADVFGLGAILAEIITGKPAYVADDATEVFRMASRGKLDECFSRVDACDAESELIGVCKKALSPEPADRFRNAGVLTEKVTQHLEGVQARLKQAELGEARAQTRRKLSVAIAALMLVIAIGAAFAAVSFRKQAEEQARLKEEKSDLAEDNETKRLAAVDARQRAAEHGRKANALRIAATSRLVDDPIHGLLLSIEGVERSRGMDVETKAVTDGALMEALHGVHGRLLSDGKEAFSYKSWPMAFSPDSRWLVVCNRLWNVQSGFSTDTVRTLTENRVWYVALSNEWLAFADEAQGEDSQVRLLKLTGNGQGQNFRDLPWDGDRPIRAMQISGDGKWLAVAGQNKKILDASIEDEAILSLWDLESLDDAPRVFETPRTTKNITFDALGQKMALGMLGGRIQILHLDDDESAPVDFPSFSELRPGNALDAYLELTENFSRLASGGKQHAPIRYWDLSAKQPADTPTLLDAHQSTSRGVVFDKGGDHMFSIGDDKTVLEWDLASEGSPQTKRVFHGHTGIVRSITQSPDQRWLITGSGDDTIRLWDIQKDNPSLSPIVLHGLSDEVLYMEVSPDGRWLVAGGHQKSPRIWDLTQIEAVRSPILFAGQDARFNANGETLLAKTDASIRAFSLGHSDKRIAVREMATPKERTCLGYSQNGEWLSVGRTDGSLELYDTIRQTLVSRKLLLHSPDVKLHNVTISEDGKLIIAADDKGGLYYRQFIRNDEPTSNQFLTLRAPETTDTEGLLDKSVLVDQLLLSRDKRRLIVDHEYGVEVCQLSPDLTISESFRIPRGRWGQEVHLSPDGQQLVVLRDGPILHWDLSESNDNQEPNQIPRGHAICVANSKLVKVANNYLSATVHQLDGPFSSSIRLAEHSSWILCLAISDDERWVATGCRDGTIMVSDLEAENPSKVPLILRGHRTAIETVDFHPSGQQLVSSAGGEIRIWDLELDAALARARSLAGRKLTEDERERYGLNDQYGGESTKQVSGPARPLPQK